MTSQGERRLFILLILVELLQFTITV